MAGGKSYVVTDDTRSAISQSDSAISQRVFKSYFRRWFLVNAFVWIVLSSFAHRLSFAAVNSKAAAFYQTSNQSITGIDLY